MAKATLPFDKAEAMKADTPATFARAIGKDPKQVRGKLRREKIYVSQDRGAFDTEAKNMLIEHFFSAPEPQEKAAPKKATPKTKKAAS